MRHIIVFIFGLVPLWVFGQQEQPFTQFMFNKMEFNPAEAARVGDPTITFLMREQWIGLDGAPSTQRISGRMGVLDDRLGLGLSLQRHSIGITSRTQAQLHYAYRLRTDAAQILLGLATSLRQMKMDFTDDRIITSHGIDVDPSVDQTTYSNTYFNVGAGITVLNDRFYLGMGVPRIRAADISLSDEMDVSYMESRHFYLMGGYEFRLQQDVKLVAQSLVKIVDQAPFNIDVNATAHFSDTFIAGLTWRSYNSTNGGLAESIDLLAGMYLNKNWLVVLSYDIGLSDLRSYHDGSLEFVLQYRIKPKERTYVNPRFF